MVAVTKDHEGAVSELGKNSWIAMVRCGCVGGSKCASSFLDTNLVKAQSLDTPTSGYSCVYPVTLILLNVPLYVDCVIDSKTATDSKSHLTAHNSIVRYSRSRSGQVLIFSTPIEQA